jgi:dihydroorotase
MSAAFGGISCVYDMPNTIPQTTTLQTLSDKINLAKKKSLIDFGVYAGVINDNIKNINELGKRCSGFKIYMGDTTNSLQIDKENLKLAFEKITSTGKPVLIHAEDNGCLNEHKIKENTLKDHYHSRPSICEEKAINDVIQIVRNIKPKLHICHLSSLNGLEFLKNRTKNISCGTTPHHLLMNIENNIRNQTYYKVNPPIRREFDRKALFDGVINGFIDIIESDHAPHSIEEKDIEFDDAPSGIPGVETMFPLLLYLVKNKKMSFQKLIQLVCEKPAELLNVPKGRLEVGRDADFIVVDLKKICKIKSRNLHSKCEWTPYENWRAIFPKYVFIRGEKLIEDHEMLGRKGFGRFVGE